MDAPLSTPLFQTSADRWSHLDDPKLERTTRVIHVAHMIHAQRRTRRVLRAGLVAAGMVLVATGFLWAG